MKPTVWSGIWVGAQTKPNSLRYQEIILGFLVPQIIETSLKGIWFQQNALPQ